MKYFILLFAALLILTGCASNTPPEETIPPFAAEDVTPEPSPEKEDIPTDPVPEEEDSPAEPTPKEDIPLTDSEIAWFNTQFFNSAEYPYANQFLLSVYETPADIDLGEVFYNRIVVLTDEEVDQLAALDFFLEVDEAKAETSHINEVLLQYTGLSFDESNRIGLDRWTYLPEFDTYYHAHGDTNYWPITIESGIRTPDGAVKLRYEDKEATLIPNGDGYYFVSNVIAP